MNAADKGESPGQVYDVDRGVEVGRLGMMLSAAVLVGLLLAEIFLMAIGPPVGGLAVAPLPYW
jgi:hypothetical protein